MKYRVGEIGQPYHVKDLDDIEEATSYAIQLSRRRLSWPVDVYEGKQLVRLVYRGKVYERKESS